MFLITRIEEFQSHIYFVYCFVVAFFYNDQMTDIVSQIAQCIWLALECLANILFEKKTFGIEIVFVQSRCSICWSDKHMHFYFWLNTHELEGELYVSCIPQDVGRRLAIDEKVADMIGNIISCNCLLLFPLSNFLCNEGFEITDGSWCTTPTVNMIRSKNKSIFIEQIGTRLGREWCTLCDCFVQFAGELSLQQIAPITVIEGNEIIMLIDEMHTDTS